MFEKKKIWACTFARGGSKGVLKKNLSEINGIPLITHAVKKALSSEIIDRVYVSTDCQEIMAAAKSAGAEVPFKRPDHLAEDASSEILSWKHMIEFWKDNNGEIADIFVSIPTVCPLVNTSDIENAIQSHIQSNNDITITATEDHSKSAMLSGTVTDEAFYLLNQKVFSQRQELPVIYRLIAGCYVCSPDYIESVDNIKNGKIGICEVPQRRSIDIDTEFDLKLARLLLSN